MSRVYFGNTEIDGNAFLGRGPIQMPYNPVAIISGSGGTIQYSGSYVIHTFTASGDFNVTFLTSGSFPTVELLVVGGGGSGGKGNADFGGNGGGGGGGVVYSGSYTISQAKTYSITVGNGGANTAINAPGGGANNGESSSFDGVVTALGGGRGAYWTNANELLFWLSFITFRYWHNLLISIFYNYYS